MLAWTLVLVVAAVQENGGASPLNPLREVVAHLDKGIAEVIKGADPAAAYKPWTAAARATDALKESLKGATAAATLSVDFDLVFPRKDAPAYVVKVSAVVDGGELRLLHFQSHEEKKLMMPAYGLDACPAEAVKFVEAARALLKAVQSKDVNQLPFLNADRIAALFPDEKSRKEATRSLQNSRKKAADTCASAAEAPEAQIRIIDMTYVVRNADGVMGTLEGGFAIKDGKLLYTLRALKPVAK